MFMSLDTQDEDCHRKLSFVDVPYAALLGFQD